MGEEGWRSCGRQSEVKQEAEARPGSLELRLCDIWRSADVWNADSEV